VKYFFSTLIEPLSFLIYFGALFFFISKTNGRYRLRILAVYNMLACILMLIAVISRGKIPNLIFYNLLYLLTGVGLGIFFFFTLTSNIKKRVVLTTSGITIIYYLISNLYAGFDQLFDSVGYVISSTGVVICVFLYFHQLMENVNEEPLSLNFDFWYSATQLVYHLGAFTIFLTYGYFTYKVLPAESYTKENRAVLTYLWIFHNVILFLGSLIVLSASIWIFSRKKKLIHEAIFKSDEKDK
jgi:hypothetical protein